MSAREKFGAHLEHVGFGRWHNVFNLNNKGIQKQNVNDEDDIDNVSTADDIDDVDALDT